MRLSFLQKKTRSFVKRCLPAFVNSSDAYIVQHLPEAVGKSPHRFSFLRSIWTHANQKNNGVDLVRLLFLQQAVEELQEITGAFAEVGVDKWRVRTTFFPATRAAIPPIQASKDEWVFTISMR